MLLNYTRSGSITLILVGIQHTTGRYQRELGQTEIIFFWLPANVSLLRKFAAKLHLSTQRSCVKLPRQLVKCFALTKNWLFGKRNDNIIRLTKSIGTTLDKCTANMSMNTIWRLGPTRLSTYSHLSSFPQRLQAQTKPLAPSPKAEPLW